MADEKPDNENGKKSGSVMGMIIWLVVVVASIGAGFAAPLVVARMMKPADPKAQVEQPDPNEEVEFIDFDEVIAVLGDSRMSRYLKLNFSLQVAQSQKLEVEKKIEARKAVLKNRIISHIAGISEKDINGEFGQNRLRRALRDYFNEILFDDGIERIQDVLFQELQVQ